MLKKATIWW